MLRTILTLLAVLPTLLPPGMCVCRLVPQACVTQTKSVEAPRRHRSCSCHRHVERTVAGSTTSNHRHGHGWNEPTQPHDSGCPIVHGTPLPRLVGADATQLVTALQIPVLD